MNAGEKLEQIANEVNTCTKCALHYSRKNGVPGEGPANAEIMFIGEGPGFHENEQGEPFVGAAGRFLDELQARQQAGRPASPLPECFLATLDRMPPATGNALGVDRLMMLLADTLTIDDVTAFVPEEL